MCELVDLEVTDLLRVRIGPIHLGDLPEGHWRVATPQERAAWWKVVRKNIIWLRVTPEAVQILPDRTWLDLTDGLAAQEGSAA